MKKNILIISLIIFIILIIAFICINHYLGGFMLEENDKISLNHTDNR